MAGFSKLGNMAKAKQCVEILLESWSSPVDCVRLESGRGVKASGGSNPSLSAKDS